MSTRARAQITFRLPVVLARRIDLAARRQGRDRSEILRDAAVAYLEVADSAAKTPYERARAVIGSLESGVRDLGSNHKRHLRNKLKRER